MFFKATLVSLLSLASTSLALTVTSPASLSSYSISSAIPVKWTSVNTDPSTINIQLVNFATFPTVTQTLASGVSTSSLSYTIPAGSLSVTGIGFQINLVSPTNNGILAQSGRFNLTGASYGPTSSASSVQTSSSASTAKSTTTTLRPTGSGSPTYGTNGTASPTRTPGTSAPTPTPYRGAASSLVIGVQTVSLAGVAVLFAMIMA